MLMIVRRGEAKKFELLKRTFAREGVDIIWDRRVVERRQRTAPIGIERRGADRRGSPPVSWSALDFVIVKNQPVSENDPRPAGV